MSKRKKISQREAVQLKNRVALLEDLLSRGYIQHKTLVEHYDASDGTFARKLRDMAACAEAGGLLLTISPNSYKNNASILVHATKISMPPIE